MIRDVIINRLNILGDEIRQNMAQNNVNASGRTSKAIKVVASDTNISLVVGSGDVAELSTLEKGISPDEGYKQYIAGTLIPAIYKWSEEKGLSFPSIRERQTFSFFSARNIATFGTKRYQKNVDIYTTARQKAISDIFTECKKEIKNILSNK